MAIPVDHSPRDGAGSGGAGGSGAGGGESRERNYRIFGVPFRTGSLYPGSENDAQPYRDAGLIARLEAVGCRAVDDGDVAIPSYLPHHTIPPIRNWPGPRIVWDCVAETILPVLQRPGHVPLLIGCDCSVVVGTAQALMRAAHVRDAAHRDHDEAERQGGVHVIYIDGDFDDAPPRADRYQSGAAMALWLLTQSSPFWTGPPVDPSRVTVIGWSTASQLAMASGAAPPSGSTLTGAGASGLAVQSAPAPGAGAGPTQAGIRSVSLDEFRRNGAAATARQVLDAIPAAANILLHFDIDVFARREMPAAYFPHDDGLTLAEGADLLNVLLKDARIRIIEMTEYAALRDSDQQAARQLVELLANGLGERSGPR